MELSGRCPQCGSPTPPDLPAGTPCARCRAGTGAPTDTPTRPASRDPRMPPPPEPEELAPHFPHLQIEQLVGQGGMGAVYRARQTKLDRPVALKILTLGTTRGASFAERFAREARTLARVSHANIVAIHDFGEAGGFYYLLMEYVDGANLRQLLDRGRMSGDEALRIIPQICDALQFAHEEGVVHRDIKPENILLDRRGRVKVADFGLAKMLQQEGGGMTLTVPGQVMGTPVYMAPEQIETPGNVDHRADIFSLGVVFYEMLTGELPLGRFPPPSRKPGVDARLDDVVLRTLEKEREDRYQNASDVKQAVTDLALSAPTPEPSPAAPPGRNIAEPQAPVAEAREEGQRAGEGEELRVPARRAADLAPGSPAVPPGEPQVISFRTVEVRRSKAITRAAVFSFVMAALYPTGMFFDLPGVGWLGAGGASGWAPLVNNALGLIQQIVSFCLAIWHVVAGIGVLRLHTRSRKQLIILAIVGCLFFPVGTIISAVIFHSLLRAEVLRLFELGEGPATLSEEEARKVETAMGKVAAC